MNSTSFSGTDETAPGVINATASLRLGFARGVSPNKWARRWAEAAEQNGAAPLELVPLDLAGRIDRNYLARQTDPDFPSDAAAQFKLDVVLERVFPGEQPKHTSGEVPSRRAVRLYAESVALVIAVDHELAEQQMADRETLDLVKLVSHPDHLAAWPAPEPWRDETWAPVDAAAAVELVATGAGAILLPLPVARNLTGKRSHAVLPVVVDPPLPRTEIWASWSIDRDDADVQQLIGVLRGRKAHSGRTAQAPGGRAARAEISTSESPAKPKRLAQQRAKKQKPLPKNSRGAQLAAAKAAREGGKNRSKSKPSSKPSSKSKKRGAR